MLRADARRGGRRSGRSARGEARWGTRGAVSSKRAPNTIGWFGTIQSATCTRIRIMRWRPAITLHWLFN
eukprot:3315096-Pyramimonas_sp.AAC.1